MAESEQAAREEAERRRRSPFRRYPPLGVLVAALLVVVAVLPSSLTLPQSSPGEVAEYAPVPPQERSSATGTGSNLSVFKLGSSPGTTTRVRSPKLPGAGTGENPTIYDCVAGRQTEDPLSPPCSPFFVGSNGGATYQGVTKDEIRVIFYMDGSISDTNQASYNSGSEIAPRQRTYCDADAPANSDKRCANESGADHIWLRITRAYERYLNSRYQTYGRHIHFWVYYSGATDAGGRRADATDNFAKLRPFAVIDYAIFRGNNSAYTDAMARNGVMVFSSLQSQQRSLYQRYDPLVWTFGPDIEQQVDHYAEFVCNKVAPYPVSHAGPGIATGRRRYAFMYTTDPGWPGLIHFRELVIPKLRSECGVTPAVTVTFPHAGFVVDTGGDPAYARINVARMQSEDVTTILWFGGVEGKTPQAADDAKFYPELFIAGDGFMESQNTGLLQNRNVWQHAAIVTPILREERSTDLPGYQAWREAEPDAPDDPDGVFAPDGYRGFFMVGMGVQVAGPRLHPTTVSEGFRAIPSISSTDPHVPACFFVQGHFCVQDATQMWWDPLAQAPGRDRPDGCYRLVRDGERFVLGTWPRGDEVFRRRIDACNGYNPGYKADPRRPGLEE